MKAGTTVRILPRGRGGFSGRGSVRDGTSNWCLIKCCHCETSAHTGRGNPPVERNQVTITTKNRGGSLFWSAIRYISPLNKGIATTSVRTGLAMTGNLEQSDKHQFAGLLSKNEGQFPFFRGGIVLSPIVTHGGKNNNRESVKFLYTTSYFHESGI